MLEIAQQVITFFTAGLLLYFIQENLKTAKEAQSSSKVNGDKLGSLMNEIEQTKMQLNSLISQIENQNTKVDMYQTNLDQMFKFSNDRHNELMEANQDLMKQQRTVVNTMGLERARLDAFTETGLKVIKKYERTADKVDRLDRALNRLRGHVQDDLVDLEMKIDKQESSINESDSKDESDD